MLLEGSEPRFRTFGGHSLRFLVHGDGSAQRTVVFLHDGLGAIESWKTIPREFSTECSVRTLIYDRWGYGGSEARTFFAAGFMEAEVPTLMEIIDATCPLVQEIHDEVRKLAKDGRQIIIIGDHGHDEVLGIMSHAKNAIVVASPEEAQALRKVKHAGVVSQSTQSIENVQKIINILMTKIFDLHFINTICFPTKQNQEQIKTLASESDVMVIIGSFTSANSKRLTQLSLEINKNTYQVNSAKDVDPSWFEGAEKVGISAGASTPDYLIDQVDQKIKQLSPELEEV